MDSSLPTDKKPFFFGAVDKLATALKRARQEPTILTLRTRTALSDGRYRSERAGGFARAGTRGRARNTLEELKGALHAYILAVLNPRNAMFTLAVKARAVSTHARFCEYLFCGDRRIRASAFCREFQAA